MKSALLPAALLIAACCSQSAPLAPGEDVEAEASEFQIGPGGVAGIKGKTPFTLQAIESAFPGHLIVAGTEGAPPVPVFRVQLEPSGEELFVVRPDWTLGLVGSVSTTHSAVRGPAGLRIDKTGQDALPPELAGDCAGTTCKIRGESGTLTLQFSEDAEAPVLARMTYTVTAPSP